MRSEAAHTAGFLRLAGGRGWMAGNGREMGKKEQDPDEEQEELDATDEADGEALEIGDSVERLRDLAEKALGKNGRKIVDALVERAKKGDGPSIKQLMLLAKEKTLKGASMKPGEKTPAQMLAEEPEWEDPPEGAEKDESKSEPAA